MGRDLGEGRGVGVELGEEGVEVDDLVGGAVAVVVAMVDEGPVAHEEHLVDRGFHPAEAAQGGARIRAAAVEGEHGDAVVAVLVDADEEDPAGAGGSQAIAVDGPAGLQDGAGALAAIHVEGAAGEQEDPAAGAAGDVVEALLVLEQAASLVAGEGELPYGVVIEGEQRGVAAVLRGEVDAVEARQWSAGGDAEGAGVDPGGDGLLRRFCDAVGSAAGGDGDGGAGAEELSLLGRGEQGLALVGAAADEADRALDLGLGAGGGRRGAVVVGGLGGGRGGRGGAVVEAGSGGERGAGGGAGALEIGVLGAREVEAVGGAGDGDGPLRGRSGRGALVQRPGVPGAVALERVGEDDLVEGVRGVDAGEGALDGARHLEHGGAIPAGRADADEGPAIGPEEGGDAIDGARGEGALPGLGDRAAGGGVGRGGEAELVREEGVVGIEPVGRLRAEEDERIRLPLGHGGGEYSMRAATGSAARRDTGPGRGVSRMRAWTTGSTGRRRRCAASGCTGSGSRRTTASTRAGCGRRWTAA